MKSERDRFGPVAFLAAALIVCSLFGAPGAQAGEMDTGPGIAAQLVSYPAELVPMLYMGTLTQAIELNVYFATYELRAEVATPLVFSIESARYESAASSGVARSYAEDLARYADDMRPREASTPHPLRC